MGKIILSDQELLSDFDAILNSVFDAQPLAKQPKFLIEIDARDGAFLRHAYRYVQSQTSRGKQLNEYPLEVIALTLNSKFNQNLQPELSGIPSHILNISNKDPETILKALDHSKIEDPMLSLYLEFYTTGDSKDFKNYLHLNTHYGVVRIDTYEGKARQTPDCFLLELASLGWFPQKGASFCYPEAGPFTNTTLNYFEHRGYKVRKASSHDLDSLMRIEEVCCSQELRLNKALIKQCMQNDPGGQLIIEAHGEIFGFALSQKLPNLICLDHTQEKNGVGLHDPSGQVIQMIALRVTPEKEGVEDPFLEFFLQKALADTNVKEVIGVLRCQNYPGPDVIGMESYVQELRQEKGSADLSTRLHIRHGAQIVKCIPSYRPEDSKNLGFGVLVAYSRKSRHRLIQVKPSDNVLSFVEELSQGSIEQAVDRLCTTLLAQKTEGKKETYSRKKCLKDMGLNSLKLLELRSLLSHEFSFDLPSNFFTLHETPDSIIEFFIETKLQPFEDWLYEISWQSTPKPRASILPPDHTWILFADQEGKVSTLLQESLHEHRQKCITVEIGHSFEKRDGKTFAINPSSMEDYAKLFGVISGLKNIAGIIYLFGLTEIGNEFDEPSLKELELSHRSSIEGLVHLANTMALTNLSDTPKLWVITQSIAQDGSWAGLSEWPLNALCKILREEYPKFATSFVAIDLQEEMIEACETLFEEIRSGGDEPQIAFRRGQRLVSRFIRSEAAAFRIPKFSSKATYLIAGGFRGLGSLLARWYASHGAKHLVLLDEIDISADTSAVIEELNKLGVFVVAEKIDLEDAAAIQDLFNTIAREMPPLKGVIHAAGVVDNDLLLHMNWNRFLSVHRLKVSLAWNLHRYTQDVDLEHFILFSSCLPEIAPLGKANHATGNSFLDVLSHYRRKRALPSLTIDWGPWELRHMEVKRLVETGVSDRMRMLRIEEGLQVLDHLFNIAKPQITAAVINWPVLFHSVGNLNPVFDQIAFDMGFKRGDILKSYMKASTQERVDLVRSYLHEKVRKILRLKSGHQLEFGRNFAKMGMKETQLNYLRNQIQFDMNEAIQLPFNFVERHPTLDTLSEALSKALEEVLQSSPKTHFTEPIAMIGVHDKEIALELFRNNGLKVELKDLTKDVIKELNTKLNKAGKPKVIIIEKEEG